MRIQEERVTKSKRRPEPHRRVGRHVRRNCVSRTQLTRIREVSFIQLRRRNRAEQIYVEVVDLRRAFDAVGRVSVSRDIERLVRVLRVIEVIRDR